MRKLSILFNYFHYQNILCWEKPLKIEIEKENGKEDGENRKEIFGNLSLNLMFNKGMLINNKNDVNLEIPINYYNNLKKDDEVKIYLEKLEQSSINSKKTTLSNDCKYLELNSNLKMYFKPIMNDKIIIFLIEEKKFTNNKDSSFSLITLSSYKIKEVKKL